MLRAVLLLACAAKVAAFATVPAGEPACVDADPEAIESEYAEGLAQAIEDGEIPEGTTLASCADVAAGGGCDEEEAAAACCATCALPQRMTYGSGFKLPCFSNSRRCKKKNKKRNHKGWNAWGNAANTVTLNAGVVIGSAAILN